MIMYAAAMGNAITAVLFAQHGRSLTGERP